MDILFCHGLESGPHGSKYRALSEAGFDVYAPDCRGKNLSERVELVSLLLHTGLVVVGSSYGGITAVLAAMRTCVKLRGVVLCAPALERRESPNSSPERLYVAAPTVIVHGKLDDMIPIKVSQRFAVRTGARLVEVDDGHRLSDSIDTIIQQVKGLFYGPAAGV